MRRVLAAVAAAVVLLVAVGGCGGSGAAAPAAAGAAAVADVLRFEGQTLDGKPFSGQSLAGKPAVLWFWAPWCPTCTMQASSVQKAAQEYNGRLTVLGVAGMGGKAEMDKFVTDQQVGGVAHLNDQTGEVWRRFQITHQSLYVLLDPTGAIVHRGWLDSEQFDERVKALAG